MKTQIYLVDDDNWFIGSKMTTALKDTDITKPALTGYVKRKWNGTDWEEGATAEEIAEFEAQQLSEQSPMLEEIIAEQQNKIDELETKITDLETKLEE